MELHAFDKQSFVAQAHHHAIGGCRRYGEIFWKLFICDNQRVISRRRKRFWQAAENRFSVMEHFRGIAVNQRWSSDHVAAIDRSNGLMAEANAEDRHIAGKGANHVEHYSSVFGPTR